MILIVGFCKTYSTRLVSTHAASGAIGEVWLAAGSDVRFGTSGVMRLSLC